MPEQSISKRYNRSILSTAFLILLFFSLGLIWFGMKKIDTELNKKVNYISGLAQMGLPTAIWDLNARIVEETIGALFLDEDLVYLSVIMDEEILTHKVRKGLVDDTVLTKQLDFFKNNKELYLHEERMIVFEEKEVAQINMVFSRQRFREALIWDISISVAMALLITFLILARTLGITRKYIFRPLRELEISSSQITHGNLDTEICYESNDEIGRLGNSFDQMRLSIKSALADLHHTLADLNTANETLEDRVKERTASLTSANKEIMDSIRYASLIQNALLPEKEKFDCFFEESFNIWSPKDVVGGDIILLAELRNPDECVLMVIDCTGHGVPGAFVTMLVKAIERELVMSLSNADHAPSPSLILQAFNQSIKNLLKQDSQKSASNAGFDGAVLCYNKAEKILRFSGAGLPLFYFQNGTLNVIKGNKQSVGYTKIDPEYRYQEHVLQIEEETRVYLTTDGYFDQTGGPRGFSFGRKRVQKMLQQIHDFPFPKQAEIIQEELDVWREDRERVDDVSFVGLKLIP